MVTYIASLVIIWINYLVQCNNAALPSSSSRLQNAVKILCHFHASYGELDVMLDGLSKKNRIILSKYLFDGCDFHLNFHKNIDGDYSSKISAPWVAFPSSQEEMNRLKDLPVKHGIMFVRKMEFIDHFQGEINQDIYLIYLKDWSVFEH